MPRKSEFPLTKVHLAASDDNKQTFDELIDISHRFGRLLHFAANGTMEQAEYAAEEMVRAAVEFALDD